MRRLATTATLLALLPLLLSACSDEEKPRPPIVSSSSPTPTPSPTQTATVPADETPEQFIRRWSQVDVQMQNSGDTTAYRETTWECEACDGVATRVEKIKTAGGYVRTDGWKILEIRDKGSFNGRQTVEFDVDAAPTTFRETADGPEKSFPGGRVTYLVELVKKDGTWRVALFAEVAR